MSDAALVTDFTTVDKDEFFVHEDTVQTTFGNQPARDLVLSASMARNSEVFADVLALHVPDDATIADVTWGEGVFWNNVDTGQYTVLASDIDPSKSPSGHAVDCRNLPYEDNSLDVVVLDPPYAEGFYRRHEDMLAGGDASHEQFRHRYSSDTAREHGSKYHQAVLDMYYTAGTEAVRVLKDEGLLIVKTQDEVSANTQELTHVQITNYYERELGLYTRDLFVVVRNNTPAVSGMSTQVHARKNHSYFLVYEHGTTAPVNTCSHHA